MFLRNCVFGKCIFLKILTGMSPRKRDTWYWAHIPHISLIPDANPRSVPCSALETAWTEDMLQFPATQSHKRNRTDRFLPRNCVYLTLQSALRGIILYYISASGLWISVVSQQHIVKPDKVPGLHGFQLSLSNCAFSTIVGTEAFIFQNSVLLTYRVCSPFWTSSPLFVPLYCRSPSPLAALQWQSINKTFERYNYHIKRPSVWDGMRGRCRKVPVRQITLISYR